MLRTRVATRSSSSIASAASEADAIHGRVVLDDDEPETVGLEAAWYRLTLAALTTALDAAGAEPTAAAIEAAAHLRWGHGGARDVEPARRDGALDIEDLDLPNRRAAIRGKNGELDYLHWQTGAGDPLSRLVAPRRGASIRVRR